MTKEECGVNLLETIRTIGGIMSLDSQRAAAILKDDHEKAAQLLARRRTLQQILAKQLPMLTNNEMDQILSRYPWVTGC